MKIVLVRHGYSVGNKKGTYTGWSDVALTEEGIEDLKRYKEEYAYPKTDRYYSSDLIRAIHTFDILFGDEHELYEKSPELREIYFGNLEDQYGKDVEINFSELWGLNERHENWETMTEFSYRIISKLEQILKDLQENNEKSATIVCHSGVIKTYLIFLGHRGFLDFKEIPTENGLGYILDMDYDADSGKVLMNKYQEIEKKD
ncbi:histidine phosphatase family protein [Erysipelothrix urinaevulpis]|uniref:histidine phosphatase family protein n=1 Tax=Erysipelothrix urinaevulpis TaxID=2683717 RepID=UPI0013592F5C|nr:histidine phosphatase family protein [Erysipelothrix urinaevulpis]